MSLEIVKCLRSFVSVATFCVSIVAVGLMAPGASAGDDDDEPIVYKGVFTPTGSMIQPRVDAESVVLNDGRVLVFGGRTSLDDPESFTNSAEIYDPATNKFTVTGSMSRGRRDPQTVLLNDGRVLVAGGDPAKFSDLSEETSKSAEIYDPSSGTFSATGNSEAFGAWDTSSILEDGRVLLLQYNHAEVFNPGTGTFSPTGAPVIERKNAAATLLKDGSVLLAGGDSFFNYCPGPEDAGPGEMIPESEKYDPATGTFSLRGRLVTPRSNPKFVTLSDGRALLLGGEVLDLENPLWDKLNCLKTDARTTELYDSTNGMFSTTGYAFVQGSYDDYQRPHPFALLDDSRILVVTGENVSANNSEFSSAPYPWAFTQAISAGENDEKQTYAGPMAAPHLGGVVQKLHNGLVLVAGGIPANDTEELEVKVNGVAELFDQTKTPPPLPRRGFKAVSKMKVTPKKRTIRRGKLGRFKVSFFNAGDQYLVRNRICGSIASRNARHARIGRKCQRADRIPPGKTGTTKFTVFVKKKAKKGKRIRVKFVLETINADTGNRKNKTVIAKVKIK